MTKPLLIAVTAGATATLLYLSVATGSILSMLLFYLAPFPLLIAGLGWGLPVGIVAALVGTGGALLLGALPSFAFAISIAGPCVWLVRLALTSRRDEAGDPHWYPAGRLILWTAALAAAVVLAALPMIGYGTPAFEQSVAELADDLFSSPALVEAEGAGPASGPLSGADRAAFAEMMVRLLPSIAAATWMTVMAFNLWLAARIARASGILMRPWPDFEAIDFEPRVAIGFGVVILAAFVPGAIGVFGQVASTVFGLAFTLLGLSTLHALTRGASARRIILGGAYLGLLLMPWLALGLIGLGLAEALTDLRAKRNSTPPSPPV